MSKTSCNDYDETECLLVDLKYSYKESPAYEIIAIKPVDWDNNAFQFYFNDGIRVHGNSLNIPKEIVISTSHAAFPNCWLFLVPSCFMDSKFALSLPRPCRMPEFFSLSGTTYGNLSYCIFFYSPS